MRSRSSLAFPSETRRQDTQEIDAGASRGGDRSLVCGVCTGACRGRGVLRVADTRDTALSRQHTRHTDTHTHTHTQYGFEHLDTRPHTHTQEARSFRDLTKYNRAKPTADRPRLTALAAERALCVWVGIRPRSVRASSLFARIAGPKAIQVVVDRVMPQQRGYDRQHEETAFVIPLNVHAIADATYDIP
jgi:hypothetical protein